VKAKDRIIVALDVPTASVAMDLVKVLGRYVWGFKIGLEAITAGWAQECRGSGSREGAGPCSGCDSAHVHGQGGHGRSLQ